MSGYPHRRRRGEAGQTTAEYVGIVVFVALLAVAVAGFITPIGSSAKSIVSDAYCKIGATLGGAGCSNQGGLTGDQGAPTGDPGAPTDNPEAPPGDLGAPPGDPDVPPGDPDVPPGDPDVPNDNPDVPNDNPDVPNDNPHAPPGDQDAPNDNPDAPPGDQDAPNDNPEAPPGDQRRAQFDCASWTDLMRGTCPRRPNSVVPTSKPDAPNGNQDVPPDTADDWRCDIPPRTHPRCSNVRIPDQWSAPKGLPDTVLYDVERCPGGYMIDINRGPTTSGPTPCFTPAMDWTTPVVPYYVPIKCNVSSTSWTGGGTGAIGAKAKAETGYTKFYRKERQPNGTFKDTYVIRTKGIGNITYEFGPKAGVAAGGVNARAGASVEGHLDGEYGENFTFDTEAEADAFAEANWGKFGFAVGREPDSTYWQAGAGAMVKGTAGPLAAGGGFATVIGVEDFKNGDRRMKLLLTGTAAAELGLLAPTKKFEVKVEGKAELLLQFDLTFDKFWMLTRVGGFIEATGQGKAGIEVGPGQGKTGALRPDGSTAPVGKVQMPALSVMGGGKGTFAYNAKIDIKTQMALGEAMLNFIALQPMSAENRAIIDDQLLKNSQVTWTTSTYSEVQSGGGLMLTGPAGSLGGELHEILGYEDTIDSWFYNPMTVDWEKNVACTTNPRTIKDAPPSRIWKGLAAYSGPVVHPNVIVPNINPYGDVASQAPVPLGPSWMPFPMGGFS